MTKKTFAKFVALFRVKLDSQEIAYGKRGDKLAPILSGRQDIGRIIAVNRIGMSKVEAMFREAVIKVAAVFFNGR